jgi:hypothetical protein
VTPKFEELGPYVFREENQKVNISWSEGNDTVKYKQVFNLLEDN